MNILHCLLFGVIASNVRGEEFADAKTSCNEEKKIDTKKIKKLQKLLDEDRENQEQKIKAILEENIERGNREEFKSEMNMFFTRQGNNTLCSKSIYLKKSYPDCQVSTINSLGNSTSILAAFTNGRLGNQMSSFASGYSVAKAFQIDFKILYDQYRMLSRYFPNIKEDLVIEKQFCDHCNFKWLLGKSKLFDKAKSKGGMIRKGNAITLPPYSHLPNWYKDFLPELVQLFDLDSRFKKMASESVAKILTQRGISSRDDVVLVGVHFRGTDYAAILKSVDQKKISWKYYDKAFKFIQSKVPSDKKILYLLLTDDPKLALFVLGGQNKQAWFEDLVVSGYSTGQSLDLSPEDGVGLDLGISTLCDHMVVSFSTLGIWMGHLSKGHTVMARGFSPHVEECLDASIQDWVYFDDN